MALLLEVAGLGTKPLTSCWEDAALGSAVGIGGTCRTEFSCRGGTQRIKTRKDEALPVAVWDRLEYGGGHDLVKAFKLIEPSHAVEETTIEVPCAVVGDLVPLVDGLLR